MKTNQKYLSLSLAAVLAITGMGFGTLTFAQTVTPVSCNPGTSSVGANQAVTLNAVGGNGSYFWSGQNLNVTNSAGNQFVVSYPNTGTYTVTVSSAGLVANCTVNVTAANSTGNLTCSPSTQNTTLGQTISVSASGGNGIYTWSSPDLSISNPNGSGFSANYASTGFKTLTVASAGLVANCAINVLSNNVVTPTFPDTGGDYWQ